MEAPLYCITYRVVGVSVAAPQRKKKICFRMLKLMRCVYCICKLPFFSSLHELQD